MSAPDDPGSRWLVGDRVGLSHRAGSDVHVHSATVVGVRVDTASPGRPVERYTVQIDPTE